MIGVENEKNKITKQQQQQQPLTTWKYKLYVYSICDIDGTKQMLQLNVISNVKSIGNGHSEMMVYPTHTHGRH